MISFGREITGDLAAALRREWLVTNGIGGFASGTVAGMNTRRYHGLLCAARQPPLGRIMTLTRLDEEVTLDDRTFALTTNEWADGTVAPHGYTLLERFDLEGTLPVFTYALAGASLEKRIWMAHGANTTYVTYHLACGQNPIQLRLRPIGGWRDYHSHQQVTTTLPTVQAVPGGVQVAFGAFPYWLQIDRGTFQRAPDWYRDFYQRVEAYRGMDATEDLFSPGYFEAVLAPGETLTLVVSLHPDAALEGVAATRAERARQATLLEQARVGDAPDWVRQLVLAADQFIVARPLPSGGAKAPTINPDTAGGAKALITNPDATGGAKVPTTNPDATGGAKAPTTNPDAADGAKAPTTNPDAAGGAKALTTNLDATGGAKAPTINPGTATEWVGQSVIAGYPWFGDWGRDTMISLPGLTLTTGRPEVAASILRTFARYVDRGMLPNRFPDSGEIPHYNTVDATLWYFEALHQFERYQAGPDGEALVAELYPTLSEIVEWHVRGTRYGIQVDQDGLLSAGAPGVQLTWMDAKVDDWVVTPRQGKPVEINALWYNALRLMAKWAERLGKADAAARWSEMAARVATRFPKRFWYDAGGYLYDVVDGPQGDDPALRPNQLLAVSLPHSALATEQARQVVDACARALLTSHGLRSLAPDDPAYVGLYGGDRRERDAAYHQGTAWGWLIGPFVTAHYKVYRDATAVRRFLRPFQHHLSDHGLGTLSEIFDGDPPHTPRGCIAQAWSVAEVLRVWALANKETRFFAQESL
jgi:glycogen debranching enzyme